MQPSPIGIFDSGIGGFTVARAIRQALPNESILYYGDTAHLPYGDKSPQAIISYSVKIAEFLVTKGAKIIVIACNSASSVAYEKLHRKFHRKVPVISVVEPVVQEIVGKSFRKVGIIGTKATIGSNVHAAKIHAHDYDIRVEGVATPLLAPMIEEGFFNNNISQTIINAYLDHRRLKNIDALVLACTHYPLIRRQIDKYYAGREVEIVDPAEVVARKVREILESRGLLHTGRKGADHFYVSDYTESFERSTRLFFGKEVRLEKKNLWDSLGN